MANPLDPHAGQQILHRGAPIAEARLAAILIHGRGASAEDILGLSEEFNASDVAFSRRRRRCDLVSVFVPGADRAERAVLTSALVSSRRSSSSSRSRAFPPAAWS
jgi:hypothetical protein